MAAVVLWETADARRGIHRVVGRAHCDTTLVVGGQELLGPAAAYRRRRGQPGRRHVRCRDCGRTRDQPGPALQSVERRFALSGECSCRTYLCDAFAVAQTFLLDHGDSLANAAAAVRTHLRKRQHESIRTRRGEVGAQVRVDRLESGRIGRQLATQEQRWLLRDIADEAGSEAPLRDDRQLLQRLAERRAERLGVAPEVVLEQVRLDRDVVAVFASTGRRVDVGQAGAPELVSWWEAYVERPLGRRRSSTDLSIEGDEASVARLLASGTATCVGRPDEARAPRLASAAALLDAVRCATSGSQDPARILANALATYMLRYPAEHERAQAALSDPAVLAAAVAEVADMVASSQDMRANVA